MHANPSKSGRILAAALLVATFATLAGSAGLLAQQTFRKVPRRGSATIGAALPPSAQGLRMREGSVLTDREGKFMTAGDRITFYLSDGDESFRMLENLALERVWRMLENARDRQWPVSGEVTEYRGANYLLITRAVLKARPVENGGAG